MGAGDAANVHSSLLVRLVRKAGVPLRQLRAVAQNLAIVHLLERSRNFDWSGRLAGLGGALRGGRWRHHAARATRPNCCRRTGSGMSVQASRQHAVDLERPPRAIQLSSVPVWTENGRRIGARPRPWLRTCVVWTERTGVTSVVLTIATRGVCWTMRDQKRSVIGGAWGPRQLHSGNDVDGPRSDRRGRVSRSWAGSPDPARSGSPRRWVLPRRSWRSHGPCRPKQMRLDTCITTHNAILKYITIY